MLAPVGAARAPLRRRQPPEAAAAGRPAAARALVALGVAGGGRRAVALRADAPRPARGRAPAARRVARPRSRPSRADALLLGGSIFDLLAREEGDRACVALARGPHPDGADAGAGRARSRRSLRHTEGAWRAHLARLAEPGEPTPTRIRRGHSNNPSPGRLGMARRARPWTMPGCRGPVCRSRLPCITVLAALAGAPAAARAGRRAGRRLRLRGHGRRHGGGRLDVVRQRGHRRGRRDARGRAARLGDLVRRRQRMVRIPDSGPIGLAPGMTLEAWVKPTAVNGGAP